MNSADFRRWLDYHRSAFPGLTAWLSDNPGQVEHWSKALSPVAFFVAKNATDAMVVDEDAPRPYSEHCRYIRMYSARQQPQHGELHNWGPRLKEGHLVANCPRCMDYGVVSVVSPTSLALAFRHDGRRFSVSYCVIACDCTLGDQLASARERAKRKVVQWQEGHCLIRADDVIDQATTLIEDGEHEDWADALRDAAHRLVSDYHEQKETEFVGHDEFADYA